MTGWWRRVLPREAAWPPTSLAALGYATAFGVVATYVGGQTTPVRDQWLAFLSTNLVNLADHPIRCLVGSAFVCEDSTAQWVVLAAVGLTTAGRALGNLRLAGLLAACHVLATVVSEAVLAVRLRAGSALVEDRLLLDVGPSYVIAPALVLGILRGSTAGRVAAGICFALLEPHLFGGLLELEVSAVGHVVAIGLALALAPILIRDRRERLTL